MIRAYCDEPECRREIEGKAALVFGPPNRRGYARKIHLCADCFTALFPWAVRRAVRKTRR